MSSKISKRTMIQFREYLVGHTLREIEDFFDAEGITKGRAPDNVTGERRSLVEAFYSTLNLDRPSDQNKLLKVYEAILVPLALRNPEVAKGLIAWLARDGFSFTNNQLTPNNVEEHTVEEVTCWSPDKLRFFISHRDVKKVEAKALGAQLETIGVSCFVAHDSIEPMSRWKFEILKALKTMEAFVCFITEDYYESVWTNQEIGFALAKKVPIYLYSHDRSDPLGFSHDIQAIKTGPETLIQLIKRDFGGHPSIKQALLSKVIEAKNGSFDNAKNKFIEIVDLIFSDFEIERLAEAINGQAKYINQLNCLLWDPIKPEHQNRVRIQGATHYRDLLAHILNQHTGKRFHIVQQSEDRWSLVDQQPPREEGQ